MKLAASFFIVLMLAPGVIRAQPTESPKNPAIGNGSTVQLEYTLKDETGAVLDSKETTVIIDLNHPLAGKILFFDVKVLGVEPPKK